MTRSERGASQSYLLKDDQSFTREKDRLRCQAQTLSQLEFDALKRLGIRPSKRILELGCGNGQYLLRWKEAYPGAILAGVDRNQKLLELAKSENPSACYFQHDLLDFEQLQVTFRSFSPDTVILRFVLQHLTEDESERLLDWLAKQRKVNSFQLLLIDPDDSSISFFPECVQLRRAIAGVIEKQASNGGDRTRGGRLETLCKVVGFSHTRSVSVNVGSSTIGWGGVRAILLPLWKQGMRDSDEILEVEKWLDAAENSPHSSDFSGQVHLIVCD